MRRFLFLPLFFCIVVNGYSRDIYVDNLRGNDVFLGITDRPTNENGPVRTIGQALRIAGAGDRIVLAKNDEPYRESVTFFGMKNSYMPGTPFTLDGNGAVLDGSVPVPKEYWKAYERGIFRFQPEFMAYANLFLDGKPLKRIQPETLREGDLPIAIQLEAKEWCLYDGYIYFKPEPGKIPSDYDLTMAGRRHGIAFLDVRGVTVKNLTVQGYQNDGMTASNAALDIVLEKVVLRGNARSGLTVGGASRVFLKDCVLGDNGAAQLWTEKLASVTLETTELISNTAPGWVENDPECTVYRDGQPIHGGLNEPLPVAQPETKEEDSPEENPDIPAEGENTEETTDVLGTSDETETPAEESPETDAAEDTEAAQDNDNGFDFSMGSDEEKSDEEATEEASEEKSEEAEDDSFNFSL